MSTYEIITIIFAAGALVGTVGYIIKDLKPFQVSVITKLDKTEEKIRYCLDKIENFRLEQVKHQAITDTKIDQMQHDIKNIRALDMVKNTLIEKIEKAELEHGFDIKNIQTKLQVIEQKVG